MATQKDQIEHLEYNWIDEEKPWKKYSRSRKYLKRQMSKYIRRMNKNIEEDEIGFKSNRKPTVGWEY